MASRDEFEAAQLTTGQRLEVLALYRRERLGARPGGTYPLDALARTHGHLARWCALGVLDGEFGRAEATLRARQCAYVVTLFASPAVSRVTRAILSRRGVTA